MLGLGPITNRVKVFLRSIEENALPVNSVNRDLPEFLLTVILTMMKWERFRSIPVSMVFLAMGFVYYVTLFVFLADWVDLQSSAGSLNILIFTFLIGFCIFSFLVCVLTDPGHVPSSYVPDVEDGEVSDHQESSKRNVLPRKCETCSTYKPPRCHHCRVCRKCVLRMDHHCIWINNCVGYWNYKAFFILVLFATIGSLYSTIIFFMSVIQKEWDFLNPLLVKLTYVLCGAPVIGLTFTLATLLGWHIYLLSHNMTTIEYYEGVRGAWLARKSGQNYHHPFDLGFHTNVTSVLGPNVLKWFWPTALSHLKDGVSFRVTRDSSQ